MDDFCKNFKGGYCERVKMHVPRNWCIEVCQNQWYKKKRRSVNVPLKNNCNKKVLLVNFASAMKRFAESGFKLVDKKTYIEREVCCKTCGAGRTCPYCGCKLKVKDKLMSEKGCPNPQTYPKLKKYPPRDYWSVVNEKTSIIIAARNEPNLNRTIKGLTENATGDIEFIVVLDGDDQDVEFGDAAGIVIRNEKPLGRRVSINKAVERASGKYTFHIDAHCTIDYGWDTKLKCACDEKTLVFSRLVSLHPKTWKPRNRNVYTHVQLDRDLREKWWGHYRPEKRSLIEESMSFTGCSWMIRKDYYQQLGGFDESLDGYGHTGCEWSLKVWCNNGRLVIRHDVVCGHVFNSNIGGKLYKPDVMLQPKFKTRMYEIYGAGISDLVRKFDPVPGWDKESINKERLVTILRYTDESAPEKLMNYCFASLKKSAYNNKIITAKLMPGEKRGYLSLYSQLLRCINATDAEIVYIAEHDVLYHPDRFLFVPPRDDTFYYQKLSYRFNESGYFVHDKPIMSSLICNRLLLKKAVEERIEALHSGWRVKWVEPGKGDPLTRYNVDYYQLGMSVDIRHGKNFTGKRKPKDGKYLTTVDYWGDYKELLGKWNG